MLTGLKLLLRVGLVLAALLSVGRAGPVENAIVAAMKLPEARNYRWISAVQDDARFYHIEGRTEIDGYTRVSMPMIAELRRKLGAGNSDPLTAIYHGASACVIQTATGWKTPEELAEEPEVENVPSPNRRASPRRPPGRSGSGRQIRYSNLQRTLSHPHEEIAIIIGSGTEIALHDEGGIAGTLSETGAKLLLVHPGQDEITPLRASGTFKLWIKENVLVKYEVRLSGTVSVGTAAGRREITLSQSSVTELHDLGRTKFEVPDEARRKLDENF